MNWLINAVREKREAATTRPAMERTTSMKIISVDPGQRGGIALLDGNRAEAWPMPGTVAQIVALIRSVSEPGDTLAVERAQPMPKQGVTSVFTYGQHFGGFEAIAACLGLRYVTVRPAEWKKVMGLNSDKTSSIVEAERLFPGVNLIPVGCRKPHDGIAEALLVGEYSRRLVLGSAKNFMERKEV
ncbi:hypothetical protein [Geobacter benzoatilyticus]|uniref:Uncharacterized protein n=1 Tax=Geobacter benzoatilyticus TaxID=2815309 RepID=A0ABX7Q3Y7_9BACT|nr:hypothetical protein [Geobacter benzoatilyticus]QSV46166.1 hypothetical protein JZM60_02460 [Geobacter benzoatilyticus]